MGGKEYSFSDGGTVFFHNYPSYGRQREVTFECDITKGGERICSHLVTLEELIRDEDKVIMSLYNRVVYHVEVTQVGLLAKLSKIFRR